jgi:hypothetical protein
METTMRRPDVLMAVVGAAVGLAISATAARPALACGFQISSPRGGETWNVGSAYTIFWNKTGSCGPRVEIYLLRAGAPQQPINVYASNSGSYSWTVPSVPSASDYSIGVRDLSDSGGEGLSAEFSIASGAQCAIEVTRPQDGETWVHGESRTIAWTRNGRCSGQVEIHLFIDGNQRRTIEQSTQNTGTYLWRVPDDVAPASGYAIRVRDRDDPTASDLSGRFTISSSSTCSYQLTTPAGGEQWFKGRPYTIFWNKTGGCGDRVDVTLLRSGAVVAAIAGNIDNTGSVSWTVPTSLPAAEDYTVRVQETVDTSLAAESGPFAIADLETCRYGVTRPAQGETWFVGGTHPIRWSRDGGCSSEVEVVLLQGGGQLRTIESQQRNSGDASWTVPSEIAPGTGYAIQIRDRDDRDAVGTSGDFTISSSATCGFQVTSPRSGELWFKAREYAITWNITGSCGATVHVDLLRGGTVLSRIGSQVNNIGSLAWTVPEALIAADVYAIRVTDARDPTLFADSATFSIDDAGTCTYQVTAPAAGDSWSKGSSYTIRWTRDGTCGSYVELHLLRDDQVVRTLDYYASNTGERAWSVPSDLTSGDGYALLLRDKADISVTARSGLFSIGNQGGGGFAHTYWLEIASRGAGSGGSQWLTDVVLRNRTAQPAAVELRLHAAAQVYSLSSVVPANAQAAFEDVVGLVVGGDAKGALEVRSDRELQLSGRIYNQSSTGTFGQFVDGHPAGAGLAQGDLGWLLQLRQLDGRYRTNLTLTNTGGDPARVRVRLLDAQGGELHEYAVDLEPAQLVQDLEPFARRAQRPTLGWGFASVEVESGAGVLVSASVIDSRTGDATTIPAEVE